MLYTMRAAVVCSLYGRLKFYKPLGDQTTYYSKCRQVYDLKCSLCWLLWETEESSSSEFEVLTCMGWPGPLLSTTATSSDSYFCLSSRIQRQTGHKTSRDNTNYMLHSRLLYVGPMGPFVVALSAVGPLLSPTPHSGCPALHLNLRPGSLEGHPTFPNLGFLAGAKGV